jgi:predicted RNA binding protein YcfA (HicA-like mRNA interferase family)
MSERLPRVTALDVRRALERDGWYISRQSGSHVILRHPTKTGRVTVALHRRTSLKLRTLSAILEQAGLTADELRRLL